MSGPPCGACGAFSQRLLRTQSVPTRAGHSSVPHEKGAFFNRLLRMRYPSGATVCELNGQTLFEVRRTEAAALQTQAELYAPDGRFIKSNQQGAPEGLVTASAGMLQIGGVIMVGNTIANKKIGIHVRSDGSIGI